MWSPPTLNGRKIVAVAEQNDTWQYTQFKIVCTPPFPSLFNLTKAKFLRCAHVSDLNSRWADGQPLIGSMFSKKVLNIQWGMHCWMQKLWEKGRESKEGNGRNGREWKCGKHKYKLPSQPENLWWGHFFKVGLCKWPIVKRAGKPDNIVADHDIHPQCEQWHCLESIGLLDIYAASPKKKSNIFE